MPVARDKPERTTTNNDVNDLTTIVMQREDTRFIQNLSDLQIV
jgi:hypothetical protein